jgi:antitoxin MazE
MRSRVQRWGNTLALRIPHAIAAETAIEQGSEVEISLEDGRLVVTPVPEQKFSLEALLAKVTADNLHTQVDTGSAEWVEVW